MAYTVRISNRFKKQFRLCMKRGLDMELINEAMRLLAANGSLPRKVSPSQVVGQVARSLGVSHRARLADDVGAKRYGTDAPVPADRHALRLVLTPHSFISPL